MMTPLTLRESFFNAKDGEYDGIYYSKLLNQVVMKHSRS